MEIRKNGDRYSEYRQWENLKHLPYNYEQDGLLQKIMSHKIWETDNTVLLSILDVYEKALVWCMKTADILCNYKNYLWHNR